MSQTSYSSASAVAFAGLVADSQGHKTDHKINGESAAIPFGIGVTRGATENKAALPDAASDEIIGVVVSSFWADNQGLASDDGVAAGDQMTVIFEGDVFVLVEEAVSPGDPAFTQLGSFRKSVDSGRARRVRGARYEIGAAAGGFAMLRLSGQLGSENDDLAMVEYEHAQVTADTTIHLFKTPADRGFVITGVDYVNPTGLAASATDYYVISVKHGTGPVIAASWSTQTGQEGTLGADTQVALTNGTLANRTVPPGTQVDLVLDETGTQTLPLGRINLKGYWL